MKYVPHLVLIFLLVIFPMDATAQKATESLFTYETGGYKSDFPNGISETLLVIPQTTLSEVSFYVTMDEVVMYRSQVQIPIHRPNQQLVLVGQWNGVSVTGEISPPWTTVKTWWHIIDEAGNSIITEPAPHVYTSNKHQWQSVEGEFATIYAYQQSQNFLRTAAQTADSAIQQLEQSYGYSLPYRPVLVFYNSASEGDADLSPFTHSAFGAYFGGRAYPGTSGIVALASENNANVISHELAHLFQFQLGGQFFDAPQWWREGDARLHESPQILENSLVRVRELALRGDLPDLTTWNELPGNKQAVEDMMKIGMSFLFFLQEHYGESSHAAFYQNWRQTRDFVATFELTYGQNLTALFTSWQIWLLE